MNDWIHIAWAGPTYRRVGKRIVTFEYHRYCGPIRLKKNGDAALVQDMPFLTAVSAWCQQGKKVSKRTGLCIWKPLPPEKSRTDIPFEIRLK